MTEIGFETRQLCVRLTGKQHNPHGKISIGLFRVRWIDCPNCIEIQRVLDQRAHDVALQFKTKPARLRSSEIDAFMDDIGNCDWMSRESLVAHYQCALANWNIALDERDQLLERLKQVASVWEQHLLPLTNAIALRPKPKQKSQDK